MNSISMEPLDSILEQYDIKHLNISNESYKGKKGVWWVQTDTGLKVLKKISNSEQTLKYILSAIRHLTSAGINIPHVNKTKDGDDYVNINGICYVLSDAIEGKNPSYASPEELKVIVKELAKFHSASRGFTPLPDTKPKIHLGRWISDYENQINDMYGFYEKELAQNSSSNIGKTIIKDFPGFYERAKKAIEGLRGNEYASWVDKVTVTGGLCHQDFAAGNLIIKPSGKIFVLDTDSITMDIPARDIRKLLNKIMKKTGSWNLELTKKFIEYYQSENPLTQDEWKVVKLDLMFPHLFTGAINKYYYQRDKEWSPEKYLKRIQEMSTFEKTASQVLDSFDSLIPK